MPSPPLLRVEDLELTRSCPILRGVTWEVRTGEHWVILGANGSGKTTLLNAIHAYRTASRGRISVDGLDYGATDWRSLRARLGLVSVSLHPRIESAEPSLHVVASGRHALLNLWKPPSAADHHRALLLLRRLGIGRLAGRPWGVVSQGERQRLLIARALMARPSVLFLDEPCAGLDPVARQRFLRNLDRLTRSRRGPAIVLVTHHVEEITAGFTHGLLLRAGRVVAAGPLAGVMTSARLSRTFGAAVRVTRSAAGWRLAVAA